MLELTKKVNEMQKILFSILLLVIKIPMRKNEWEKYFRNGSTLCGRSFTRPAVSLGLLLLLDLRQSWSSQITSITPHKSRSCHLNTHGFMNAKPLGFMNSNAFWVHKCKCTHISAHFQTLEAEYMFMHPACGTFNLLVCIYMYMKCVCGQVRVCVCVCIPVTTLNTCICVLRLTHSYLLFLRLLSKRPSSSYPW